jgi:hypothetical protein
VELQAQKPLPDGQGLFDFQTESLLEDLRKKSPVTREARRILYLGCGFLRKASPKGASILVELQAQPSLPKAMGVFLNAFHACTGRQEQKIPDFHCCVNPGCN